MAFTGNYVCDQFRLDLCNGGHKFNSHTFRIALYDENATLNNRTTVYNAANELPTGGGYTAGGIDLINSRAFLDGSTVCVDFDDLVIPNANFSVAARGALIYNVAAFDLGFSIAAVCVLDFGRNIKPVNQNLTIKFPSPDRKNAILTFG